MVRSAARPLTLLALSLLSAGCASTAGLGPGPYRVGPITVTLADAETVDRECRFRAPLAALGVGPIQGCYLPGPRPRIYSIPDPYVLLHEFKHHHEGAFHDAPR